MSSNLYRIALHGTRHAVTPAAALAEFESSDLDDLDTGLAHLGNGVGVAFVCDHHARFESDDVVPVIPLLTLLLILIATSLDDLELGDAKCGGARRHELCL